MATAAVTKRCTPEEYLALERKAGYKSEYCNGFIIAMSGASREHNLIAGNVHAVVWNQLTDRPCEVYQGDMRVRTSPTGLYTYPDVVAFCGVPLFLDDEVDTLLNPSLIVEVLSPSTAEYDREGKFEQYKNIESLRECVLISQSEVLVEYYVRQGNEWIHSEIRDLSGTLVLDSIGCLFPLRQIYQKVSFPG